MNVVKACQYNAILNCLYEDMNVIKNIKKKQIPSK